MSQSRTLLRRRKDADQKSDGEGGTKKYIRTKPSTPERRIVREWRVDEYLHSLHSTKGYRRVRQPA